MKTIRAKLAVIVITLFVVALGVLAGLNYWQSQKMLTQDVENELALVAQTNGEAVGLWIAGHKKELEAISRSPIMTSGNREAMVSYIISELNNNKLYENIFWTDAQGNYLDTHGVAGNSTNRPYFSSAIAGNTFITDPILSPVSGKLVMVIATPIKAEGRIVGILAGSISIDEVEKRILGIKVAQTGYAYVLRKDGTVIIHPNKELVVNKSNALTNDPNAALALKAAVEKMINGEKGLSSYNYLGEEKYLAYAPIIGTSWAIGTSVPVAEARAQLTTFAWTSLITIVVVLILAIFVILLTAVRITKPLQLLEGVAGRVASGDLSITHIDVTSQDELGRLARAFETMVGNLRTLVSKISTSSEQVAASAEEMTASADQSTQAANQVAGSISDVSKGMDEQLTVANDTSAVVQQMSASIQQIAANISEVAAQSAQAATKANAGNKSVDKAVSQMASIEQTVLSSAGVVANLGERSKEIGQIVDTISGIAGQTNLLALNAAIEAARAGEQGRGFAVVAEEVRKLAEQSQEAAKKIAILISEIQGDTNKAVIAMDSGTREVKLGAEVVNASGQAFQEITTLVTHVSDQVSEISSAIEQMASDSEQIVGAVKRINDLSKKAAGEAQTVSAATEEQSASMEEIASSSQVLAKLAMELREAVSKFKV
ncbi:Methyl-accepting chemotaxis protein McpB [Sporomusa silvacetica DSM 10669]|uniref:Methyl-accepting chemotaxis protein McpB n=1 Tax=Sporomusa silvacetica DSM 10669 TaxID=1123289 RepID=A0ABZ3IQ51_9FIRM|nr:methyl-accepting chemotaxis protein [Sporomusa silvacetica]OZC13834.1 methyl-accepting chemotaxis protein McpB [Sporomusa silvacetica DSM 10669]